jgi:hypothetical protein
LPAALAVRVVLRLLGLAMPAVGVHAALRKSPVTAPLKASVWPGVQNT